MRYNAFHDQLLLSAGSDSRVLLSNMSSLASDVGEGGAEEHDGTEEHDGDLTEGQRRARSVQVERQGRDWPLLNIPSTCRNSSSDSLFSQKIAETRLSSGKLR